MNLERWKELDSLFQSALVRSHAERAGFINDVCSGDEELRKELEALVAAHENEGNFIESPALEIEDREVADELIKPEINLREGQTIGHYHIVQRIGAGGMGEVYLAQDLKLGRKVALKLLPARFTADTER